MKKFAAEFIRKIFRFFNLEIIRLNKIGNIKDFSDVYCSLNPSKKLVDLDKISALANNINGMISCRAGEELFSLAYMQATQGDVVEVGSWQGRSTFFLGSAAKYSGNGKVYAIDHFHGNVGREHLYKVENDDLSDLELGFRRNISLAKLDDTVSLINKPNNLAAKEIKDKSVRLLFIDGDHTKEGVLNDLKLFKDKLKDDALIAFDDYAEDFPGLIEAVNNFVGNLNSSRVYRLGRTLVVQL